MTKFFACAKIRVDITNLTKTKINADLLQEAAAAAFAVLDFKKEKISSSPQLRARFAVASARRGGTRWGGVHDAQLLPSIPSSTEEGRQYIDNISLVFVDDKKILELNSKYRHKNQVTDVLSFEDLNEIFICLPQARRQVYPPKPRVSGRRRAKLLKTPLKSELTRLLVHGILHLKGYDHERSKLADLEMKKMEEKIFEKIKK